MVALVALGSSALAAPPPSWMAGPYAERLRAIRQAGPADSADLETFLFVPPDGLGATADELATLKNEAGVILLRMPRPPESLAGHFMDLAADPAADPIWRDYCVQFLGLGFPKWSAADRKKVVPFLGDVAEKGKGATGGTALIALCNNAEAPEVGVERVKALALSAVKDASYGDGGRISALQVCARLNVADALPEARALATSTTLRASAIAAIGALGDTSDVERMRVWSKSPDRAVNAPSRAALKRLGERLLVSSQGVSP
jgi:hypothetical protein